MAGYKEKMSISMLILYSEMDKKFRQDFLTTGFFNKIVADMRRAGIVYVDGPWVRLSDGAWALHVQEQERLLNSRSSSPTVGGVE